MTLWERGGKLVLNNSQQPIDCGTCPCVNGHSCCFSAGLPDTLTVTVPTSVSDGAGCSGCNYLSGRSFVTTYTTDAGGICRYNGTVTSTSVNCFGAFGDTIYTIVQVSSTGSTNCTVFVEINVNNASPFIMQYQTNFGNSSARPWVVNQSTGVGGNFCTMTTSVPTVSVT